MSHFRPPATTRRTASVHHAVDARRASETLPTHDLHEAAARVGERLRPPGRGAVVPVVHVEREERDAVLPRVRDGALLEEQDGDGGVLAQARGEDAPGRAAAGDDVVVRVGVRSKLGVYGLKEMDG